MALQHGMGCAGYHRVRYGSTSFHFSADASTALWVVENPLNPAWQRQQLDPILLSASIADGFELLHASAAECDAGVVASVARPGSGKSSVERVRSRFRLFSASADQVAVRRLRAGADADLGTLADLVESSFKGAHNRLSTMVP